jgi:hypothetical protein
LIHCRVDKTNLIYDIIARVGREMECKIQKNAKWESTLYSPIHYLIVGVEVPKARALSRLQSMAKNCEEEKYCEYDVHDRNSPDLFTLSILHSNEASYILNSNTKRE